MTTSKLLNTLTILSILFFGTNTVSIAQSCNSAAQIVSDIWDAAEDKAVAVGCSSASVSTGYGLVACAALKGVQYTSKMITYWNSKVNNSWATIGPRSIQKGDTENGNIIGTTGRKYITPYPLDYDNATITINEKDGKGKMCVVVCTTDKNGNTVKIAEKWFNDTSSRKKKKNEKRTITISNSKAKVVSIHFDGKSVTNSFKYSVSLD